RRLGCQPPSGGRPAAARLAAQDDYPAGPEHARRDRYAVRGGEDVHDEHNGLLAHLMDMFGRLRLGPRFPDAEATLDLGVVDIRVVDVLRAEDALVTDAAQDLIHEATGDGRLGPVAARRLDPADDVRLR